MISVDPDHMPHNVMSDQGLHCLPYIPVGPYFYNEVCILIYMYVYICIYMYIYIY